MWALSAPQSFIAKFAIFGELITQIFQVPDLETLKINVSSSEAVVECSIYSVAPFEFGAKKSLRLSVNFNDGILLICIK